VTKTTMPAAPRVDAVDTTMPAAPAVNAVDSTEATRGRLETALIVLVGTWFLVPRLVQTFSVSKEHTAVGDPAPPYTALASAAQRGLFYLTVGLCLWIIALLWRHSPSRRGLALIVFLLPWAYLVTRDKYAGQSPENVYRLMPLLAVTIWMLRPRLARLQVLGYVVGVTVVTSVLVGIALPDHGVLRNASGEFVTVDKQILPWGSLVGIFTNGNNLGQFIAMGLPTVMLIRARGPRSLIVLCSLFALVWSASRSSIVAVGLAIVAYVIVSRTRANSRAMVALVFLGIAFAAVGILPLITRDPGAFTNRGAIWHASRMAWEQDPAFGNGSDWFSIVGSSSASLGTTVFHAHNQFLQLLVTGGVVLAVLVGVLIVTAMTAAARLAVCGHTVGVSYLAAIAGTCMLEVSLVIVDNSLVFPVAVLPLLFILFTRDLDDRDAAEARPP
jgi:O-antigen ligase